MQISPSFSLSFSSLSAFSENSSRCTREAKKARSRARSSSTGSTENLPLSRRAEPRVIRVTLRLEAVFPTDASAAPTAEYQAAFGRGHAFRSIARLSLSRSRFDQTACGSLSSSLTPLLFLSPRPPPLWITTRLGRSDGFVVGGQAGVRKSFSIAAHMHATASDRCTTSCRRSYYGNAVA